MKNNQVYLYLPGGFVGSPKLKWDDKFEEKYGLRFISQGCVRSSADNEAAYNQVVFSYLDKKYGNKWRAKIRKDVIGFKK